MAAQARGTTQLVRLHDYERRLMSLRAAEEPDPQRIEAIHLKIMSILAGPESKCCALLLSKYADVYAEGEYGVTGKEAEIYELVKKAADMGCASSKYAVGEFELAGGWRGRGTSEAEPEPEELRSVVENFKDAARGCDCWVDGKCSTDATKFPHSLLDHAPSRRAALRLAEAYEEGLLGTAADVFLLTSVLTPTPTSVLTPTPPCATKVSRRTQTQRWSTASSSRT